MSPVKNQVQICPSAIDACPEAEAVVIVTQWKEFRKLDWQAVYGNMSKYVFVFDVKLLVHADKLTTIGFKVKVIG